jgi:phage gpG-like protein
MADKNAQIVYKGAKKFKKALYDSLPDVGTAFRTEAIKNFNDEAYNDGGKKPWKKLSPKYKARKNKDKKSRAILVRSGKMKNSIRWFGRTSKSVSVGSAMPYAVYHNEPNHSPQKQRQFLGFSKNVKKSIDKVFDKHLENLN